MRSQLLFRGQKKRKENEIDIIRAENFILKNSEPVLAAIENRVWQECIC